MRKRSEVIAVFSYLDMQSSKWNVLRPQRFIMCKLHLNKKHSCGPGITLCSWYTLCDFVSKSHEINIVVSALEMRKLRKVHQLTSGHTARKLD